MSDVRWENLDAAFGELEREVTAVVRGITVELWNSILVKTPQYYGQLAASWSYSLNAPQFYDRGYLLSDETAGARERDGRWYTTNPLKRGHPEAIGIANADSAGDDLPFKLGDTVYIANGADHGEGPYAQWAEDAGSLLRAVNRPGKAVSRSIDAAATKYGKDVSKSQAARLVQLTIQV